MKIGLLYCSLSILIINIISCPIRFNALLGAEPNTRIIISKVIDLKGQEYHVPDNVILQFTKSGKIVNGSIIGSDTRLEGYSLAIFNNVSIKGKWNVPDISTKMFENLSYDNSLRDVLSLAHPDVNNRVYIAPSHYYVSLTSEYPALDIPGNTTVIHDGVINLRPNTLERYYIFRLQGENICLKGTGQIIGDKSNHLSTTGEWGMGVYVTTGKNIKVSDLTIKDCWGDCICVCYSSKNVHIDNCKLINGRRQGISITSADSVYVSNCIISKVGGTAPQYAIDVEADPGHNVDHVVISNVNAYDCHGGYLVYGAAERAHVGSVKFIDCNVINTTAYGAMYFVECDEILMDNCYIEDDESIPVFVDRVTKITAYNTRVVTPHKEAFQMINKGEFNIKGTVRNMYRDRK